MYVFGSANSSLLECEFGVGKGKSREKIEGSGSFLLHHAVMGCDECLRLGIHLRYRVITTEEEAASQKDLDHNKPPLLICDVKHC